MPCSSYSCAGLGRRGPDQRQIGEPVGEQDDVLQLGVAGDQRLGGVVQASRGCRSGRTAAASAARRSTTSAGGSCCSWITHSALLFHASTPTSSLSARAAIVRSAAARLMSVLLTPPSWTCVDHLVVAAVARAHRLARVDREHLGHRPAPLRVEDLAVHGQQIRQRRLAVAADAVALAPADGHQPAAEVAHGGRQRLDLVAGERAGVDVDHHDAGVGDQLLDVGDVADADDLGADAAGFEGRRPASSDSSGRALDHEDPRRPVDRHGGEPGVVVGDGVAARGDHGLVAHDGAGVGTGGVLEAHGVVAWLQLAPSGVSTSIAVAAQRHRRRRRLRRHDVHDDGDPLRRRGRGGGRRRRRPRRPARRPTRA